MINKYKLRAFRDWFAEADLVYEHDLVQFCLAAHAIRWDKNDARHSYPSDLTHIFGVSAKVAYSMYNHPTHYHPSKNDALDMLDKLIETGKVVWPT